MKCGDTGARCHDDMASIEAKSASSTHFVKIPKKWTACSSAGGGSGFSPLGGGHETIAGGGKEKILFAAEDGRKIVFFC